MSVELGGRYLEAVTELMRRIHDMEGAAIDAAAQLLADQVAADRLIHVYAPSRSWICKASRYPPGAAATRQAVTRRTRDSSTGSAGG